MSLYLKSIWMKLKCDAQYKISFILITLSTSLYSLVSILGIWILLDKFGSIDGWTRSEVMLTTSLALFGHAVVEMFGRGLDHFHKQVNNGLLDRILVRPRNITLQVLCSDFEPSKIGRIIEALAILIYGIVTVNIEWTPYKIFTLLLMISGSMTLFFAILLLKASFSFWTIEGMEAMNIISDGGRELSSYPISIYSKWFANIFTFVIPFGCINYYPLLYILDKGNVPIWYSLTPLAAVIFLVASYGVWTIGLKQYKSAGS